MPKYWLLRLTNQEGGLPENISILLLNTWHCTLCLNFPRIFVFFLLAGHFRLILQWVVSGDKIQVWSLPNYWLIWLANQKGGLPENISTLFPNTWHCMLCLNFPRIVFFFWLAGYFRLILRWEVSGDKIQVWSLPNYWLIWLANQKGGLPENTSIILPYTWHCTLCLNLARIVFFFSCHATWEYSYNE